MEKRRQKGGGKDRYKTCRRGEREGKDVRMEGGGEDAIRTTNNGNATKRDRTRLDSTLSPLTLRPFVLARSSRTSQLLHLHLSTVTSLSFLSSFLLLLLHLVRR